MGKGSGLFSLLDYLPYIKPPFCSSAIGVNKREMIFWGDLHRAYDLVWERVNKQGNIFIHYELSLLEGRKGYYM